MGFNGLLIFDCVNKMAPLRPNGSFVVTKPRPAIYKKNSTVNLKKFEKYEEKIRINLTEFTRKAPDVFVILCGEKYMSVYYIVNSSPSKIIVLLKI